MIEEEAHNKDYAAVSPCQASAYLPSELKSQGAEAPREGGEMTQCL